MLNIISKATPANSGTKILSARSQRFASTRSLAIGEFSAKVLREPKSAKWFENQSARTPLDRRKAFAPYQTALAAAMKSSSSWLLGVVDTRILPCHLTDLELSGGGTLKRCVNELKAA